MQLLKAIRTAVKWGWTDGKEQPFELTSGMTYKSRRLQFAYDWSCNVAQFIYSGFRTRSWTEGK